MHLHSDIIIFEILKLYYENHTTPLALTTLEKAFYTLIEIISIKERKRYSFDFNTSLEQFYNKFEDYLNLDDTEITLTNELSILEIIILNSIPDLTTLDNDVSEYIHNIAMYKILNIEIPLDDTKDLFALNKSIMETFHDIAVLESKNLPTCYLITKLSKQLEELDNQMNSLSLEDITKIKMSCAYYNLKSQSDSIDWLISLFGETEEELSSLDHNLIEYQTPEIELKLKMEAQDNYEPELNEYFDNDLLMFLIHILISLNDYIKNSPEYNLNCALIYRKYLILSLPDLKGVLSYFLITGTIDDLSTPKTSKEYLTANSLEHLKPFVMQAITNLKYPNTVLLKNPKLYEKTIISALAINAFLSISINDASKKQIEFLLAINPCYRDSNYSITKRILDNVLSPNLKPKK